MTIEREKLFLQALQHQQEGQLLEAIAKYQRLLEMEPNHQEALHRLGLAYAQLEQYDKSIVYFQRARAIESDAILLNNLANAYKKIGKIEEAKEYYLAAITCQPEYAQAHHNLATVYAAQNDYSNALSHYGKAVNLQPDFIKAHFNLGLLLLDHQELIAAKTQFKNVLSLQPDHLQAQFYLGVLYLEEQALVEAEQAFLQVLQVDDEQVEALTNLGVIALKSDRNQQAIDYFSKALALDNHHIQARNNLAATFMHFDRFENALMHYDVLLHNQPNNVEYLYNSGVAEMTLGHLTEAMSYFKRLLALEPRHTHSLNNMAAIYLKMNQREQAQHYLELVLATDANDTISQHMLNALTATTKATTVPEYAQNLFNNYALYYDQHVTGALHYSIPHHLGRIIHRLGLSQMDTLDLGCGTGLVGVVLRESSRYLTGVDIAEKMLSQARSKVIYDHLFGGELTHWLSEHQQQYSLIVAADVLPYFGDLNLLFSLVAQHLIPEGYFIFTTEINESAPWQLETSARFSHQEEYIHQLSRNCLFKILSQEKIPGRLQNNVPLPIMMYVLQTGR